MRPPSSGASSGAVPAPRPESARMRARFDAALQGYIDGQSERRRARGDRAPARVAAASRGCSWRARPPCSSSASRSAASLRSRRAASPEIAELRQELRDTRQMVTLSLLTQQSASERLKGVTSSSQIEQPGQRGGERARRRRSATTPNVNVRLATRGRAAALRRPRGGAPRRGGRRCRSRSRRWCRSRSSTSCSKRRGPDAATVLRRLAEDMMLDKAVRARAERGLRQVGL